jgi:Sulfotransferase family
MVPSILTRLLLSSRVVARRYPFKTPPVLLLSYPRSGSSWIGAMLARSPDVAYLREPVTQPYLNGATRETVVDPESDLETKNLYESLADRAFAGVLPWRLDDVVESADAFALRGRRHRTLVIKEVNPLAAGFYVRRYRPKIVMILRHPAAIAESYERLGWLDGAFEEIGFLYGTHLAAALEACRAASLTVLRFEELALDPRSGFRALFDSLALQPPDDFEGAVVELCETPGSTHDAYEVRRSSREEAFKWRERLEPIQIGAVMRGYLRSPLPYYRDDR